MTKVWELLRGGKLSGIADDGVRDNPPPELLRFWTDRISIEQLVSQALRFLSTAIRSGHYKALFSSKDTISTLVQGVVVPNVALRGKYNHFFIC